MHEYSNKEYIKLFRKLIKWEWYTEVNTCHFFIYCLLKANWKDGKWRGIACKRGQFITSLPKLSKETGLSIQNIRTAIKHLELTGELTDNQQANYRVITVLNYDLYQGNQQTNQQPSNRQLTDNQQTANSNIRNNKNNKEQEEYNMASPEEDEDDGFDWNWDNVPEPKPIKEG